MYENYKEARTALDEFTNHSFSLTFKNREYRLYYNLNLFPQTNFLGVFNRILETKNSITFSIENRDPKKYIQQLLKYTEKRKDKYFQFSTSHEVLVNDINNSNYSDKYLRAEEIAKKVFSPKFIEKNNLENNSIKEKLNNILSENNESVESKSLIPLLRFEEIRSDLRIILSISPIDVDVKLRFGALSEKGIYNPISEYFYNRFNYEPAKMSRFKKNHLVRFLEKQGYPSYPLTCNNIQTFYIEFNLYSEAHWQKIAQRSNTSLRTFLNSILILMDKMFGADLYQRNEINKKNDYYNIKENFTIPNNLNLLHGKRVYSGPEYDILIEFQPSIQKDDNENDFLISTIKITVMPFDNKERPDRGVFLHPLIYNLDK